MLKDSFERKFTYLRLSVTDRCNFKCSYCLPSGYKKNSSEDDLSLVELKNLVAAFVKLGIKKIRLTGGEPTVRRDLVEIAEMISQFSEIECLAVTTNGYKLYELAPGLRLAGVSAINVSIDSLNTTRFKQITGKDHLDHILKGIERAIDLGFRSIKVNAVLLKDKNQEEIFSFLEYIKDRPISVRFIELMQTSANKEYFDRFHLSANYLEKYLLESGWKPVPRGTMDGPAKNFSHLSYRGQIGIIAPYSKDFCLSCNRLRVTSKGRLRLCLFGEKDGSLREYLCFSHQTDQLISKINEMLRIKPISHYLNEGKFGNTINLSQMGG